MWHDCRYSFRLPYGNSLPAWILRGIRCPNLYSNRPNVVQKIRADEQERSLVLYGETLSKCYDQEPSNLTLPQLGIVNIFGSLLTYGLAHIQSKVLYPYQVRTP